jgi:hypothetical protein
MLASSGLLAGDGAAAPTITGETLLAFCFTTSGTGSKINSGFLMVLAFVARCFFVLLDFFFLLPVGVNVVPRGVPAFPFTFVAVVVWEITIAPSDGPFVIVGDERPVASPGDAIGDETRSAAGGGVPSSSSSLLQLFFSSARLVGT